MPPIMPRLVSPGLVAVVVAGLVAGLVAGTAACRLDPLVPATPGASANLLPSTATIPPVTESSELTNQITLNDSLDDDVLEASGGVIPRSTGGVAGNGAPVAYWAFGEAERAPAPIYVFGTGDPMSASFQRSDHPPLVDAVPGDGEYEPIHTIQRVAFTDKYRGEKITTPGALADAIELGLVEVPVAIKVFVNWPIVRPGTRLEVGGGAPPVAATQIYAHGYRVDSFPLGGALGMQPNPFGLLPTSQVSFLREQGEGAYNRARPIFQATRPVGPPGATAPNYTPVSVVIDVDLAPGVTASSITRDSDLFIRSPMTGAIVATTARVIQFTVTTTTLDLQMQFMYGLP
jgi:hypothetical protein